VRRDLLPGVSGFLVGQFRCRLTIVGGVRDARGPSTSPLGGYLNSSLASFAVHSLRVGLAALTMIAIAFILWLTLGVLIAMLGLERYFGATSAFLWVVSITFLPILAGGYISARRITPNSVLHPVLAAILVALLCLLAFARGALGLLPVGMISAAVIAAAIGAVLARNTATPPNNRRRGP